MRKEIYEKFAKQYAGEEVIFYDKEIEHQKRLLFVLETKMRNLTITDQELFRRVRAKFGVSYTTVLKDSSVIERIIANERDPQGDPMKVWTRYWLSEVAKKAIAIAAEKNDAYSMLFGVNVIGRHHLTDKEDVVKPDYDKIIPFKPELTIDPSVIGIKLPDNFEEIRQKYRKKFDTDFQRFVKKLTIPDAEIIQDENE